MGKLFKRTRATIVLSGILLIALSIITLVVPVGATILSCTVVGWALIAAGVITIVTAFVRPGDVLSDQADLVIAGVELVPGFIMVMDPTLMAQWLWGFIGLYIVLTGVDDAFEALELRGVEFHHWTWRLAVAIFTMVTGLIVFGVTFYSQTLSMLIAVLALFLDGVSELISGIRLRDPDKGTDFDE